MPSPEKFYKTLVEYKVSDEIIGKIQDGFECITSKTKKSIKAEYFNQALSVMEDEIGIDKTREIFQANGCCKTGARLKASKEFAQINTQKSIQEKLEKIREAPYLYMGSPDLDENGDIVVQPSITMLTENIYVCALLLASNRINPKIETIATVARGTLSFTTKLCSIVS